MPFLQFHGLENLDLAKFHPSENAKNHENQNSEPLNVLKWQFLDL